MLRELLKRALPSRVIQGLRYIRNGRLNWQDAPAESTVLVGMTTGDEQVFYTQCARSMSHVHGAIVDLGSWMGSTAVSLARGVRKTERSGRAAPTKVYAVDRFVWEAWMAPWLPQVFCDYLPGDSFLPEVRRRIRAYCDIIELLQEDLTTYTWNHGPIKLLLVDAMKSGDLARRIAISFYPSLTRGSILIHQDFKHFFSPWIHLLQFRLREHFRCLGEVPNAATVAFRTVEEVSADAADRATRFSALSDAEVAEAFGYSKGLVDQRARSAIAAAHVMFYVHRRDKAKARQVFTAYCDDRTPRRGDFALAKDHLDRMKD